MASSNTQVDQLIGQFGIPVKGVWRTLAAHQLPIDVLYDARNVVLRDGAIRPRSGALIFGPVQALTSRPLGAREHIIADGLTRYPIVSSAGKIHYFSDFSWVDITGAITWSGSADIPNRITSIAFGTPIQTYSIICNGLNTPVQWSFGGNCTALAGSPPVFHDVATIADRVVGLVGAYEIRWGEGLSLATWPATNTRILADTEDKTVAIRNLGTLGGVVYKQKSIWAITTNSGGPSSSAYRFDIIGMFDGPVNPAAVVDCNGTHIYMTDSGRIGMFNGTEPVKWIVDGVWPIIRGNIDALYLGRIFGVYDPVNHEVIFYYPGFGDEGQPKHMVTINLPYPTAGIQDFAAFPGTSGVPFSAGCLRDHAQGLAVPLVFSSIGQQSYSLDGDTTGDDDVVFNCYIHTGLVPTPELAVHKANCEPYMLRGDGFGTATMQLMSSYILDTEGGTAGDDFDIDLSLKPATDIRGFDARGRFFGLKLSFTSADTVRYYGSHLYATRLT